MAPLGISFQVKRLRATRPHDYIVRFFFGGLVCVAAGLVGSKFGPGVGGLFLAFPAILPASLTLIAKHTRSGRCAGADALGSSLGSVGLIVFAIVVFGLAGRSSAATTLALASCGWLLAAVIGWVVFEAYRRHRRQRVSRTPLATGVQHRG